MVSYRLCGAPLAVKVLHIFRWSIMRSMLQFHLECESS